MSSMGNKSEKSVSFKYKIPDTPKTLPYFFMSFLPPKQIQVFHATVSILDVFRSVGAKFIQQEEIIDDVIFIFIFKGEPFAGQDLLATKHFLCDLLAALYEKGWDLALNTDVALRVHASLSTWYFRKTRSAPNGLTPGRVPLISCLYMTQSNVMQLFNIPEVVFESCMEATKYMDGKGSQITEKDFEIQLRGTPWKTKRTTEAICARLTVLAIIRAFAKQGFKLLGCGNFNGQMDALFFQSDPSPSILQSGAETAFLVLHDMNKLWLVQCSPQLQEIVETACSDSWPAGIDYHLDSGACFQLKLNETPWNDKFSPDTAMYSRFLLCVIFQRLRAVGWKLDNAFHMSQREKDRAVFVLKPCEPQSVRYLCICPQGESRLCLVNGEPGHNQTLGAMLGVYWQPGIRVQGMASGCYQWKLHGSPWRPKAKYEQTNVKHLMCMLLAELSVIGWRVSCSADISAKFENSKSGNKNALAVQSWFVAIE